MQNKLVDIEIKPMLLKEDATYNCLLWRPVIYLSKDKVMRQTTDIRLFTEPTRQFTQYITYIKKVLYIIVAYEE